MAVEILIIPERDLKHIFKTLGKVLKMKFQLEGLENREELISVEKAG